MALNSDYIRSLQLPTIRTVLTDKDAMFYALSIGLGRDPLDEHDLRYVYEGNLKVFPTMPLVIGHPGNWMIDRRTGVTRAMVVHGAQRLWSERELPVNEPVLTTNKIVDVFDKGDQGAVLVLECETTIEESGERVSLSESYVFCRADGNFGGRPGPGYQFAVVPDRPADRCIEMPTEPNMALYYRLNHDRNPLHADPAYALRGGFDRPILHGLASYGVVAVALIKTYPDRILHSFETRFSKPVFPGETISVDVWEDGDELSFRARVAARNVVVLDRGLASFRK